MRARDFNRQIELVRFFSSSSSVFFFSFFFFFIFVLAREERQRALERRNHEADHEVCRVTSGNRVRSFASLSLSLSLSLSFWSFTLLSNRDQEAYLRENKLFPDADSTLRLTTAGEMEIT